MKLSAFSFLAAIALLPVLSGCNRTSAGSSADAHDHEHAPAATYKEGHGIQLSAAGKTFVQLEIADVGTRDVAAAKAVTAVPATALLRTVKGNFVFVANGEWLLRTPVAIGATDGAWFEIKDGLYEGDRVVVRGTETLWLAEIQAVNGGVGCAHGH